METYFQTQSTAPGFPGAAAHRGFADEGRLEECRALLGDLLKKTEALYQECRADQRKIVHIREIGSTLASLTILVERIDEASRPRDESGIFSDGSGNTYQAVRSCDLDRFIDK